MGLNWAGNIMDIGHHPELLDRLAASYALGTLRGPARRRLEAYARQSATVRTSMLLWQERMCALTELAIPIVPSANVWKRIENALTQELDLLRQTRALQNRETLLQASLAQLRKVMGRWRVGAVAGAMATMAAIGVGLQSSHSLDAQVTQLAQQLKSAPQIQYVAVLSDDKSSASMLVTFDLTKNSLTLKRVGAYQEDADKSLQLWALPASGGPQSLGVLGQDKVIRIAAPAQQVITIPMLAVSLEPKGGVPSATGPTGPVLFKGALLETAL
jgi:anti-sigma-K factor RskA